MRVISGTARGRKLKKVPGDSTRPIMDRVKENLFNLLRDEIADLRWLDLFAGTGQVGIEALSRGAAEVVFIDTVQVAIRTIEANLRHTQLAENGIVIRSDAFAYLKRGGKRLVPSSDYFQSAEWEPFDLIYVAPPQYQRLWVQALQQIDKTTSDLLTEDGIVVVQIDPKESEELTLKNLSIYDQRKYGNTLLIFFAQNKL